MVLWNPLCKVEIITKNTYSKKNMDKGGSAKEGKRVSWPKLSMHEEDLWNITSL